MYTKKDKAISIAKQNDCFVGIDKNKILLKCSNCKKEYQTSWAYYSKTGRNLCRSCSYTVRRAKHGLCKHPIYAVWQNMKGRIRGKDYQSKIHYSTKGMFKTWETDFKSFYDWSIGNGWKDGLTIDRIDANKGYFPENCRWVNQSIQSGNKRLSKSRGKSKYLGVWKDGNKWVGEIKVSERKKTKPFALEKDAALWRDNMVKEKHLPYTLNFKDNYTFKINSLPPTLNHFYVTGKNGRKFKTKRYNDFISLCRAVAISKRVKPIMGYIEVLYTLHTKGKGRADLDNTIKSVLDAFEGYVFKNDRQVVRIIAEKKMNSSFDGFTATFTNYFDRD